MKNLTKKIQNNIFQKNLFSRGDGLVLGISGGPDSICLLEIFAKLQKKYNLQLILAHINYNLRGKESDLDQKLVENLAQKYGLELFILYPKINKKFSEESLRDIRYDFFEKIRKENKFDYIAVAHTLDDQVETFLMRLLRGAGLAGLSGIKFKSEKIIRPLLNVSKKEILEFLKKNKIRYRIDKTNKESIFFRNKIRNILIPLLEKEFNPKIKDLIFKNSLSISEDYARLSYSAQKEYSKNFSKEGIGSVKKILGLHPSLQKMVIREAIGKVKNNLRDIDAAHIDEILKALKSSKNKSQKVFFKRLKMVRNGDKLKISL